MDNKNNREENDKNDPKKNPQRDTERKGGESSKDKEDMENLGEEGES